MQGFLDILSVNPLNTYPKLDLRICIQKLQFISKIVMISYNY